MKLPLLIGVLTYCVLQGDGGTFWADQEPQEWVKELEKGEHHNKREEHEDKVWGGGCHPKMNKDFIKPGEPDGMLEIPGQE